MSESTSRQKKCKSFRFWAEMWPHWQHSHRAFGVTHSYDPTKNRYAVISINGQGGRNVNVTVNGVDNKDSTVGGTVMQLPLEAVSEFVISTQRFSAANGRSEGAAINMITRSGTNDYHGSLFGFFRDQALNAQNVFEGEKGPYSRQFFGGSFGAPIIKDKLFGFFALERQRESTKSCGNSVCLHSAFAGYRPRRTTCRDHPHTFL